MLLGFTKDGLKCFRDKLTPRSELTDLQETRYYLAMTFKRKENVVSLHQAAYCRCVSKLFEVKKAKSTLTSMVDKIYSLFEGAEASEAGKKLLRHSRTDGCWGAYCP